MLLKYVDECKNPSMLEATRVFGDKDCGSIKAIDKQGNCHTLGYLDKKENVQKVFDEIDSDIKCSEIVIDVGLLCRKYNSSALFK